MVLKESQGGFVSHGNVKGSGLKRGPGVHFHGNVKGSGFESRVILGQGLVTCTEI